MEYKSGFGKSGCHIENIGELLQEFDAEYVADDGKVIQLKGAANLVEQVLTFVLSFAGTTKTVIKATTT